MAAWPVDWTIYITARPDELIDLDCVADVVDRIKLMVYSIIVIAAKKNTVVPPVKDMKMDGRKVSNIYQETKRNE